MRWSASSPEARGLGRKGQLVDCQDGWARRLLSTRDGTPGRPRCAEMATERCRLRSRSSRTSDTGRGLWLRVRCMRRGDAVDDEPSLVPDVRRIGGRASQGAVRRRRRSVEIVDTRLVRDPAPDIDDTAAFFAERERLREANPRQRGNWIPFYDSMNAGGFAAIAAGWRDVDRVEFWVDPDPNGQLVLLVVLAWIGRKAWTWASCSWFTARRDGPRSIRTTSRLRLPSALRWARIICDWRGTPGRPFAIRHPNDGSISSKPICRRCPTSVTRSRSC